MIWEKLEKGLTKCTANEFVQSRFQDFFLGVLYIKKIVPSPFFVCLKNFRTNFTDSQLPGLKGASLFWTEFFFFQYASAVSYEIMCRICMIFDRYFFCG